MSRRVNLGRLARRLKAKKLPAELEFLEMLAQDWPYQRRAANVYDQAFRKDVEEIIEPFLQLPRPPRKRTLSPKEVVELPVVIGQDFLAKCAGRELEPGEDAIALWRRDLMREDREGRRSLTRMVRDHADAWCRLNL